MAGAPLSLPPSPRRWGVLALSGLSVLCAGRHSTHACLPIFSRSRKTRAGPRLELATLGTKQAFKTVLLETRSTASLPLRVGDGTRPGAQALSGVRTLLYSTRRARRRAC